MNLKSKLFATLAVALGLGGTIAAPVAQAQDGTTPYVGQIEFFAGNFAPRGWAFCNGQLLAISQNDALFSLLGTIYGGDGRTTFALPDMRGRVMLHAGQGPGLSDIRQGPGGGAERHTLSVNEMPSHSHSGHLIANAGAANAGAPAGAAMANAGATSKYRSAGAPNTAMAANSVNISNAGGNQAFNLRNPFVGINCIIALVGIYPSRS